MPAPDSSTDLFSLNGQVAVVIGGTGGLGGSIASALAAAGATVAVCGRSAERGNARVEQILNDGGAARFFSIDAMSRESLAGAHKAITTALGPPAILVNAAGGTDPRAIADAANPVGNLPLDAWQANFDLNLVGGALLPCQEFGPGMVERKAGSIINIASVSAHIPLSRVVAYSASKAAVLSLTKFLAREWAPHNVRVNSITPGFFPTEQNRHLLFHQDGSPTPRTQSILSHTPMGRFGSAHELAGAAIFLASQRASGFVTGADICVDGGFLSQTI